MEGVRVDTWVETGSEVTPYYDSLLAKVMVFAPDRPAAIAKLQAALAATQVPNWLCWRFCTNLRCKSVFMYTIICCHVGHPVQLVMQKTA